MTPASSQLDDLPFTKKHLRILTGSGVGWALDAMDVGLVSFIIAALTVQWHITGGQAGLITSMGFVGMAIGASLGGILADRFGRRQIFAFTLLLFGIATGASALAGGVAVLIVLRFFVGLGLGSELPVASTYVSEFSPSRIRGRIVVILEAFWAVGWIAAAVIGTFVVGASENGWRWAFLIGTIPAAYAFVVRWSLPESPRWLESKGRFAEARAIVDAFIGGEGSTSRGTHTATASCDADADDAGQQSASAKAATSDAAADAVSATRASGAPNAGVSTPSAGAVPHAKRGVAALFSPALRVRTVAIWAVWFCVNFSYYGAFIWIPTILVGQGFGLVKSFEFTLLITLAQLPGYAVAAWLIEKWGRRVTLGVFLTGSGLAAVLFGTSNEVWQILVCGSLLSFFNLGAWGALYAVTPELYPTRIRATGAGWAAGVGRIASIIAPLFTPWALGVIHKGGVFAVFAGFFLLAALLTCFLVDRSGRSLDEETAAEPQTVA